MITHAAGLRADLLKAAQSAGDQIVFAGDVDGTAGGVLFLPLPGSDFQGIEISRRTEENAPAWRKLRGLFRDYPDEILGANTDFDSDAIASWDRATGAHATTGFAFSDNPSPGLIPRTAVFRNTSTHILARELTPREVEGALTGGHVYVAHDWLCDPTGFTFFAGK